MPDVIISQPGAARPAWRRAVAQYQAPDTFRSLRQLTTAVVPYLCLLYLIYLSIGHSYWLMLPLSVLASGLLVRIGTIFHDCAHGSFFRSRAANDRLGTALGLLMMTPYHEWRRRHALHHATSSDLGRRGWWDFDTMTVEEYLQSSPWRRLGYRLYRNPLVLFGLAPLVFFLIIQRLPAPGAPKRARRNVHLTNAVIVVQIVLASWLIGFNTYVLVQLPPLAIAAGVVLWLFYVQHQFEDAYWANNTEWDFFTAALEGSSFYRLPSVLQWFTGNVGYHHIHHLSPQIPNYHLQSCHDENPSLRAAHTLTLLSSFRTINSKLWDERTQKMISFGELKLRTRSIAVGERCAETPARINRREELG